MIFSRMAFFCSKSESWALEAVSGVFDPDFKVELCKVDVQNQYFAA